MKKTGLFITFIIILGISPFLPHPSGYANDFFEEISTDEMLFIKGVINKVSIDKMQLAVRPFKGKRVLITFDSQTLLEGIYTIEELDKEQQVKVWYSVENNGNKALKIIKMMDLGC